MYQGEERLRAKIAALESKCDLLESEILHLDKILRECGFPNGINTLKSTVEELIGEARGGMWMDTDSVEEDL
jgi:hypothetical protein